MITLDVDDGKVIKAMGYRDLPQPLVNMIITGLSELAELEDVRIAVTVLPAGDRDEAAA